jgi:hypothetical protein
MNHLMHEKINFLQEKAAEATKQNISSFADGGKVHLRTDLKQTTKCIVSF